MKAVIDYYDGLTYFVTIKGISQDVITADHVGMEKNFTRDLIQAIYKGWK